MLVGRSSDEWVAEYSQSHQHPINRACHTLGIPLIAVSLALFVVAWFVEGLWPLPTALFVVGWVLQFVGHAFEGKPPEFFKDPRLTAPQFIGLVSSSRPRPRVSRTAAVFVQRQFRLPCEIPDAVGCDGKAG